MRHYETVFIMVPDLPDEERDGIVERYQKVLTDAGGEMLLVDEWGRRRLAYEIKNFSKGHYVLFEHASNPTIIAEMERQMRLDDQILRYLTIKVEDVFDRAAYEARKASEAPSQPGADDDSEEETREPAEKKAEPEEASEPEAVADAPAEPEEVAEPEEAPEPEPEAEETKKEEAE